VGAAEDELGDPFEPFRVVARCIESRQSARINFVGSPARAFDA